MEEAGDRVEQGWGGGLGSGSSILGVGNKYGIERYLKLLLSLMPLVGSEDGKYSIPIHRPTSEGL